MIGSPIAATVVGEAVLSTVNPPAGVAVTVAVDGSLVTGAAPTAGGVPVAVAVLTTVPASKSAAVVT